MLGDASTGGPARHRPPAALALIVIIVVSLTVPTTGQVIGPGAVTERGTAALPVHPAPSLGANASPGPLEEAVHSLQSGDTPLSTTPMRCQRGSTAAEATCATPNPSFLATSGTLNLTRQLPQWYQLPAGPPGPTARAWASLAYDGADGYVVLFGGYSHDSQVYGDTWTYANGTWTQLNVHPSPSPRAGAAMAFDPGDGYLVLFGGLSYAGPDQGLSSQTWTFHQGAWSEAFPSSVPAARYGAAMAYDTADQYLVLFGGSSGSHDLNDTWSYQGGQWTNRSTGSSPSPRADPLATYDGRDGYLLFFGGQSGDLALNDTWAFEAGEWTELHPAGTPAVLAAEAMTYDPYTGNVVLFGSSPSSDSGGSTWTFAAGTWTERTVQAGPAPHLGATASFDASDGYLFLYDGESDVGTLSNVWAWEAPILSATSAPDSLYTGGSASFSAAARSPSGDLRFAWTPLSSGLTCTPAEGTTTLCTALDPGAASLLVNVTDGSGAWTAGTISVTVTPLPTVSAPVVSAENVDVGETFEVTSSATGGMGQYTWSWSGLPPSCSGLNTATVRCTADIPGPLSITASVTDSQGRAASSRPTPIGVFADPELGQPTASASAVDVGQDFNVSALPSGGISPFSWSWSYGAQIRCSAGTGPGLQCLALSAGRVNVSASIRDAGGIAVTSRLLGIPIFAPPVARLSVSPGNAIGRGSAVYFVGYVSDGAGDNRYLWNAGHLGCSPETGPTLVCRPMTPGVYTVRLTVLDRANGSANASAKVTILGSGPSSGGGHTTPPSYWPYLLLALVIVAAALVGFGLLVRRPARSGPPTEGPLPAHDMVGRDPPVHPP